MSAEGLRTSYRESRMSAEGLRMSHRELRMHTEGLVNASNPTPFLEWKKQTACCLGQDICRRCRPFILGTKKRPEVQSV